MYTTTYCQQKQSLSHYHHLSVPFMVTRIFRLKRNQREIVHNRTTQYFFARAPDVKLLQQPKERIPMNYTHNTPIVLLTDYYEYARALSIFYSGRHNSLPEGNFVCVDGWSSRKFLLAAVASAPSGARRSKKYVRMYMHIT